MNEKDEVIQERLALIEMYKAGFLDAYRLHHKMNNKKEWLEMNNLYKDAFCKRFEKKVKKIFKKL